MNGGPSAPHAKRMVHAFCALLVCWGLFHALETAAYFGLQQGLAVESMHATLRADQLRETLDDRIDLRRLEGNGRPEPSRMLGRDAPQPDAARDEKIRRLRERIDGKEEDLARERAEERVEALATSAGGYRRFHQMRWINYRIGIFLRLGKGLAMIVLCWSGVRVVLSADATKRWRIVGGLGACVILFQIVTFSPAMNEFSGPDAGVGVLQQARFPNPTRIFD